MYTRSAELFPHFFHLSVIILDYDLLHLQNGGAYGGGGRGRGEGEVLPIYSRTKTVKRAFNLAQVLPRQPSHPAFFPAPWARVSDEIAGVKPRHHSLPVQRTLVIFNQRLVRNPLSPHLGDTALFVGQECPRGASTWPARGQETKKYKEKRERAEAISREGVCTFVSFTRDNQPSSIFK